jgi:hypothetical protein
MRYEKEHMGPPKVRMPYPDLLNIVEYKTAYQAACSASEPMKGERPDRDPQVGPSVAGCAVVFCHYRVTGQYLLLL